MRQTNRNRFVGLLTGLYLLSTAGLQVQAQPAGVDADAVQRLRAMSDFLAGQQTLSVDTQNTLEVVLESGQKLQFDNVVILTLQRPNKLLAVRSGDLVNQQLYYDGKTLTLHNPDDNVYATVAVPDTLEGMLDYARESLDLVAPAGDLLYRNAFEILSADVDSGFRVGSTLFDDVSCDHFAFRNSETDWQIWIRQGAQPLPCKLVITSREILNAPQFEVNMSNWRLGETASAGTFQFKPGDDDLPIEFLLINAPSE
jgi:hypothetical protein